MLIGWHGEGGCEGIVKGGVKSVKSVYAGVLGVHMGCCRREPLCARAVCRRRGRVICCFYSSLCVLSSKEKGGVSWGGRWNGYRTVFI